MPGDSRKSEIRIRSSHLSFIQVVAAILIGIASFLITSVSKVGSAVFTIDDRFVSKGAFQMESRQHEIDIARIEHMIRDQNEKIDAVYQFLITGKGRTPHGSRSE